MAERDAAGLVAQFDSDRAITRAASALRDEGFTHMDAFVPRPITELEKILVPERPRLPLYVLLGGLAGAATGLGVQWLTNAYDYPLNVGGRPPFSLPAFIPITFEMMILFAAVTAFVGTLWSARLPRLSHFMFAVPDFERASIDRFFLFVSADDPRFSDEVGARLADLGARSVVAAPAERREATS